ncbi:MAG: hypothetical protein ACE5LQ_06130, partial [Candidatus Bipolaricaulia bacterium]
MEQAILWAISLLAFGLFARRTRYLYRLLRLGQPEERTDRPGQRIRHLFTYVLIHRRLFNERGIGIAHTLFFWGFVFYAASFAWLLLKGLLPALPIPAVEEVGPVTLILEVFAVLVLIGLGVAVYRRYIAPPPHLESTLDSAIILILVTLLVFSFLLFDGFGLAAQGRSTPWAPLGSAIARLVQRQGMARGLHDLFWWLHVLIVLGFLVYIPYSKHLHL